MPNKIRCSDSRKAAYKAYAAEDRAKVNKLKKIERHLKKQPNDTQAKKRSQEL